MKDFGRAGTSPLSPPLNRLRISLSFGDKIGFCCASVREVSSDSGTVAFFYFFRFELAWTL